MLSGSYQASSDSPICGSVAMTAPLRSSITWVGSAGEAALSVSVEQPSSRLRLGPRAMPTAWQSLTGRVFTTVAVRGSMTATSPLVGSGPICGTLA